MRSTRSPPSSRTRNFAIIDVDQSGPEAQAGQRRRADLQGAGGRLPRRLPGRAGREARAGPDVIGSVGGFKEPPVDRFIAGYQAGARRPSPAIEVAERLLAGLGRPGQVQGARAQPDRRRVAASSSRSRAGAGSALSTRAKEKVWGIGVDADQAFLGPHVLTSAQKKVDAAVFPTIESVQDGSFEGGRNAVFGLKEKGVGLGKISQKAPPADVKVLETVTSRSSTARSARSRRPSASDEAGLRRPRRELGSRRRSSAPSSAG